MPYREAADLVDARLRCTWFCKEGTVIDECTCAPYQRFARAAAFHYLRNGCRWPWRAHIGLAYARTMFGGPFYDDLLAHIGDGRYLCHFMQIPIIVWPGDPDLLEFF